MTSRSTAAETTYIKTTYQPYHASELGMGADRDGIIILLSMDDRDYAMFVYGGHAEYAFDRYGQKELEDAFARLLRRQRLVRRALSYLDTCEALMECAEGGKEGGRTTTNIHKHRGGGGRGDCLRHLPHAEVADENSPQKAEANEYVAAGGLNLTKQYDRYTHTTETRRKIHDDSDSDSGTSSCSGGGGSGRSGKF